MHRSLLLTFWKTMWQCLSGRLGWFRGWIGFWYSFGELQEHLDRAWNQIAIYLRGVSHSMKVICDCMLKDLRISVGLCNNTLPMLLMLSLRGKLITRKRNGLSSMNRWKNWLIGRERMLFVLYLVVHGEYRLCEKYKNLQVSAEKINGSRSEEEVVEEICCHWVLLKLFGLKLKSIFSRNLIL